jgi:hypothetical protein
VLRGRRNVSNDLHRSLFECVCVCICACVRERERDVDKHTSAQFKLVGSDWKGRERGRHEKCFQKWTTFGRERERVLDEGWQ